MPGPKDIASACQALESTLLKQLLSSSGAFTGSDAPGGSLHAQMFVDTLADAVAKSGGMGLGRMLEQGLGGEPGEEPPAAPSPARAGALPPLGGSITSAFGECPDPIDGGTRFHAGVDLRAAEGAPIRAVADGVVRSAGARGGYGNAVEVDHGGGVTSLYAHASALSVQPGERVVAGAELGRVGHTGRATGPHLHFELRRDGHPENPLPVIPRP